MGLRGRRRRAWQEHPGCEVGAREVVPHPASHRSGGAAAGALLPLALTSWGLLFRWSVRRPLTRGREPGHYAGLEPRKPRGSTGPSSSLTRRPRWGHSHPHRPPVRVVQVCLLGTRSSVRRPRRVPPGSVRRHDAPPLCGRGDRGLRTTLDGRQRRSFHDLLVELRGSVSAGHLVGRPLPRPPRSGAGPPGLTSRRTYSAL